MIYQFKSYSNPFYNIEKAIETFRKAESAMNEVEARYALTTKNKKYILMPLANSYFLCGRYEGIDQRIIDEYVDEEVSIGDYVLSSGEVSALVVIDSVYRLIEGVISPSSLESESFVDCLLEYPQYTRPAIFREQSVPEVLLSGHHANIEKWRHKKRIEKTYTNRPDLIEKSRKLNTWTRENDRILEEFINDRGN